MADWIRTYTDGIDAAIKANFNTKLAEIDANLRTLPNDFVFKTRQPFSQRRPLFHQYIINGTFDEVGQIGGYDTLEIQHYTGVRSYDDESSTLINSVWVYWEAMLKTIYDTDAGVGKLSNTVCQAKPVQVVPYEEITEGGKLAKEAGLIWRLTLDVNLQE